jgi:CRP-like cAMP-binding protein
MTEFLLFRDAADAFDVPAGWVLFSEGQPGDVMYAIVDGQVDVTLHGQRLETLGPGTIVGEMALVDSSPRSTTAVATTPARIVRVDRRHFMFLVHEHPTFALQVMSVMAERLRRANEHA